jgi:preprotein translocase subunit SecE
MSVITKPISFLKEVKAELGKVAWSTREEIMQSTMVVITTTALLTVFIWLVDVILSKFLTVVLK